MNELILSLFPGIGLLDRAFEEAGFQIVRGPDIIWGGDVHRFSVRGGVFAGVIGGPPCQVHSNASEIVGTQKVDLIPEFLRIAKQAEPRFIVMENVENVITYDGLPEEWNRCVLRDFDCGGMTSRKRAIFTWPFTLQVPDKKPGKAELSVMASTWKRGASQYCKDKGFLPGNLPIERYGELQGYEELSKGLEACGFSRRSIIYLLGNGVPHSIGSHAAKAAREYLHEWESVFSSF